MEYLEEQIVSLATLNSLSGSFVPGLLCSGMMDIICLQLIQSLLIHTTGIEDMLYASHQQKYEVELFLCVETVISSIKTTNKILNITASIFANENGYDNCLLLNDSKKCS
jgi:branched-chain amino acid aminotransferase